MIPPNSLVFVIDDDASVRKGLSRLLRSAGYKSEIFSSAADFLARSPHPGPCCVIVDVRMPGLNGIEVAKELTKCPPSPAVVICSVENAPEIVEAARQAGALGYVFKSRIAEDLIVAVKSVAGGQSFVSPR